MMVALVVRTLLAQSVALRTARSAHRTSMRSVTSSCSWNLMPSVWMMSRPGAWRLSGLESQLTWSGMKASFLLRQDWRRLFWVQGDAGLRVLSEICFAGLPLSICDSCLTWFLLWFQKVSCRSWKKDLAHVFSLSAALRIDLWAYTSPCSATTCQSLSPSNLK